MRAQRPACSGEIEIIITVFRPGGRVANGEDKRALFPRVADEPRRAHMRRWLRGAFGLGSNPHLQLAIGQGHNIVAADFLFQFAIHFAVEILDLVIGNGHLLEPRHHRRHIGFLPAVFLRDLRGQGFHLRAQFIKTAPCLAHQPTRILIDTHLSEVEGIKLLGKACRIAAGRKDGSARPFAIVGQLLLHRVQSLFCTIDFIFRKQVANARDEGGNLADRFLNLYPVGPDLPFPAARLKTSFGKFSHRFSIGPHTRGSLKQFQRFCAPAFSGLIGQELTDIAEQALRNLREFESVAFAKLDPRDIHL